MFVLADRADLQRLVDIREARGIGLLHGEQRDVLGPELIEGGAIRLDVGFALAQIVLAGRRADAGELCDGRLQVALGDRLAAQRVGRSLCRGRGLVVGGGMRSQRRVRGARRRPDLLDLAARLLRPRPDA